MVFVTGGTGLVGSRLIYDLVSSGKQVFALKRKSSSVNKFKKLIANYTLNVEAILDQVTWLEGDLFDQDVLEHAITEDSEVYHCAAQVSFNPKDNQTIISTNVEGTANLVNVCLERKVRKLVHVSSIGAIGSKVNGSIIKEETPWLDAGKSSYSLSKYHSEMEVWRGIAEGLNAVIVNPAVILGAGDWNNGSASLFSKVAKGMKYATLGSTAYVSVEDVSKAMIELMKAEVSGERFILAERNLSYKELFEAISRSINRKDTFKTASFFLTAIVWRFEKVLSIISGNAPRLTKHTHRIAHKRDEYSGEKIKRSIDFEYKDIMQSINEIGKKYLMQNQ